MEPYERELRAPILHLAWFPLHRPLVKCPLHNSYIPNSRWISLLELISTFGPMCELAHSLFQYVLNICKTLSLFVNPKSDPLLVSSSCLPKLYHSICMPVHLIYLHERHEVQAQKWVNGNQPLVSLCKPPSHLNALRGELHRKETGWAIIQYAPRQALPPIPWLN